MSRHNNRPKQTSGIKLPFALQQELGIERSQQRGNRRPNNGAVRGRKEQRKLERQTKRTNVRGSNPKKRNVRDDHVDLESDQEEDENEEDVFDEEDSEVDAQRPPVRPAKKVKIEPEPAKVPKSILKKPRLPSPSGSSASSGSSSRSRSSSPGLVLDASSKAFRERAAQDDAEIAALEKRLGGKKKSKSSDLDLDLDLDDGLDYLLAGLEGDEDRGSKRKSEEDEWLERKRRKAEGFRDDQDDSDDDSEDIGDIDIDDDEDEDDESLLGEDFSDEDDSDDQEDGFEGFESEDEPELKSQPAKKVRENPYVAPVANPTPSTAKYVPPSLRKAQATEGESIERLKRQLNGQLNKLSEANLISILGEVEKIYQTNPRQDVTTILIELLISLFCNKMTLQNTFVILHAAFAAAVYKVIGVDFGAGLLSHLVDRFDTYHSAPDGASDGSGKESLNLTSFLSNLFTFHVVSSTIILDHIRLLLSNLTESSTELLLRLIRDCGPQLRQDDPTSLKSIIQLMQQEISRMEAEGIKMSVRTKFMVETITDLKNNKMKNAASNAGLSSEHITRMRKALGSLNNRSSLRGTEPLRIGRDDIKNSDRKGKWWLVGASWKGNDSTTMHLGETSGDHVALSESSNILLSDGEGDMETNNVDLAALAREYGMNTSVRRSIFITLLSSVDAVDCQTRLLKLRLKRSQETEIPPVVLRCAGGEKEYNHYYTLVAKRLCMEKRMRKGFMFALWGWFRRLGEKTGSEFDDEGGEDEEEEEEDGADGGSKVSTGEISAMARLYACLILDGAETLGILKVLDLAYMQKRTSMFVELLLILILKDAKDDHAVRSVCERAADEAPQVVKRLQFFVRKTVRGSDLVAGKKDAELVKSRSRVMLDTFKMLQREGANGVQGLEE
ncbi:hypothetical protein PV10_00279 [Exophiala mesophila]|uniref:MI domain-containing protein n=1 Tax=Exophiala mesophila TaxID=212818 RepID=A0A0D1ZP64_EXOME|nr:uncharacterized protein PV10_00279 [Exophiala mesophila]KIV96407.1 hypothetical protein PV10_00279 [Exophiala mesophila]